MKKPVFIIVALFIVTILLINGFKEQTNASGDWQQNIRWTPASITQDEVKSSGKPVYLFVSTEWCTFCRKMKAQTFKDPEVQQLLNELFIAITINPEKPGTASFTGEELSYSDLARRLRVGGYPASFFFDPDGKLIGGQPGYIDAAAFADMAEYVGDGHHAQRTFTEFQQLPPDQRR